MRTLLLAKNIFGTAATRAINIALTAALVPLTINSLRPEEYAIFAVALSYSVFVAYSDLGLGFALIDILSQPRSTENDSAAKRAVSSVWYFLIAIAIILLLPLLITFFLSDSASGVKNSNAHLIIIGLALIGLPGGIAQRILFAQQRIVEANIWNTSARTISLIIIYIICELGNATALNLSATVVGIPVVAGWLNTATLFTGKSSKYLCPNLELFSKTLLRKIAPVGLTVSLMQVIQYIESNIDVVFLSKLGHAASVPAFDVYQKLYNYLPALISIAATPLWPAISAAIAAKDNQWVQKTKRRATYVALSMAIVFGLIFYIISDQIVQKWTQGAVLKFGNSEIFLLIFALCSSISLVQSMIIGGLGIIQNQVKALVLYGVILMFTKYMATNVGGIDWLLAASAIAIALKAAYFHILINRRLKTLS